VFPATSREHWRVADASRPIGPHAHRTGFFHPYLQVLLCEGLVTTSEVLLKLGARETAGLPPFFPGFEWIGANGLYSKWVWLAIPCMIASFVTWLWLIRAVPLNIASLLSSVVHIMVPLSCLLILGEHITARRWCGIALVLVGLVLVVRPADHHEDPSVPLP
jgi:drug/metabolite transporter (DMT)-like permease